MNAQPFSIENIKLKHLCEYARKSLSDSRFADVSPISLIRALGQSKNPHADPEDVCLVVGYEDNRCVGYHGVLPGFLRDEDRQSRVYWLVTFFLKPDCRGKGYGKALLVYLAGLAKERDCGRFEWSVLDWNEPAIKFYKGLGAKPMDGWTVYRVAEQALDDLGAQAW